MDQSKADIPDYNEMSNWVDNDGNPLSLTPQHLKEMMSHLPAPTLLSENEVIHRVLKVSGEFNLWSQLDAQCPRAPASDRERYWHRFSAKLEPALESLKALLVVTEGKWPPTSKTFPITNPYLTEIGVATDPWRPSPAGDSKKLKPPGWTVRDKIEEAKTSLEWIYEVALHLEQEAKSKKGSGGSQKDEHDHRLVKDLANIYEDACGQVAEAPAFEEGKFLSFAAPCVTALDPDKSWENVAGLIRRAFKERVTQLYWKDIGGAGTVFGGNLLGGSFGKRGRS